MLKIGDFSKIAKTTIKTLRYYDEIGIFKPYFVDENGYRYYNIEQLDKLLVIMKYRSLDLSIENIINILNGADEHLILINHLEKLEKENNKLKNQIHSIKYILEGEKKMSFDICIKTIPSFNVYYRHGIIDSMSELTNFVLETGSKCSRINPNLKCLNYCYVTYTDTEYKETDVELEYVEAVDLIGVEDEEIKFRVDPEIKALCVIVKGSYLNLSSGYSQGLNEVKKNNYKIVAPLREVYIHGCWDKEKEDDYLTEIQIPIE